MTGRKVLAMLLGFFALIVLVNGIFLYFALTSFSGLSTDNAYVKGLNYNQTLAQGRAQKAAGWELAAETHRTSPGQPVVLRIRITDGEGRALENLTLSGQLRRPTHAGADLPLTFRPIGDGSYQADVAAGAGQWDLALSVPVEGADAYRWEKRLWLK